MTKTGSKVRVLSVAVLAGLAVLPTVIPGISAPANYGAHGLTTGFGRGRLDFPGIVSEGVGRVNLPEEPMVLTLRLSGAGVIQLRGRGVDQAIAAAETPTAVRVDFQEGGPLAITSSSRIRLHEITLARVRKPAVQAGILGLLGVLAVAVAARGLKHALAAGGLLSVAFFALTAGTLSFTFARIAMARLVPAAVILLLLVPSILAFKEARFHALRRVSRLGVIALTSSLILTTVQLLWFDQPLPLGDPGAYFEMGGRFAEALAGAGFPFDLGPALSDVQAYLALPATGMLYGLMRLAGGGLTLIYAVQALAMSVAVGALVSICEIEIGPRAAKVALCLALLHPTFSILPGIVQPEPFILAAWTLAALLALDARRGGDEARGFLAAGLLFGIGLSLHPQGLSFLLLALGLCLVPWVPTLARRPALVVAPFLGICSVLLPVAAAGHFAKPRAYVLDKQYGFFAFTSSHPLGFWLYMDSDGWQGPLRIEETRYQKELIALNGAGAVSSTFADAARFALRHPRESAQTVLTNLHRLWQQPDNLFAVPFVLPFQLQTWLHRSLVVLFVMSLPALLSGRLGLLALPFVMLSMTYPAYHVFNKYATPALTFTIMGAAFTLDRLWRERARTRVLLGGLVCAALGALLPAVWFARLGVSGDHFLLLARGLLWIGLGVALASAIRAWGGDTRSRVAAGVIGFTVLLVSSWAAVRSDTERGTWSVALDRPFEASCRLADSAPPSPAVSPRDPAWLLIDAQSSEGAPPRIEVNGRAMESPVPMMPTFGLASIRGHRSPATFRQMWGTPIDEDALTAGEIRITVRGDAAIRVFGDIREGNEAPRLSIGDWPHLSVYRLMHEGQYRLPVDVAPAQACSARGLAGRPGVALARIKAGLQTQIALKSAKAPAWIF